jgi:hypothetical protein
MQDNRDNTRARRAVGHSPLQIRVPKTILGTLDTAPCSCVLGEPWPGFYLVRLMWYKLSCRGEVNALVTQSQTATLNSQAAETRESEGRKPGMNQNWLCPFRHNLASCCLNLTVVSQGRHHMSLTNGVSHTNVARCLPSLPLIQAPVAIDPTCRP